MSYKIVAKYLKDINFKIPNSKSFFFLTKNISNYKINIDIKSNQIKEKIIEVETSINLIPSKENNEKICSEILYSTIIELDEKIKDKKEVEKIVLVKVPGAIYPELRKIFIFVFESSGFKDIKINSFIDFQKLYNLKKVQ